MAWARLLPAGGCGLATALAAVRWPAAAACDAQEAPVADPADAELKLVQVVFRHGARTPLTGSYWDGTSWEKEKDCRQAFEAVRLSLRTADGGPPPFSVHDNRQVSTVLPGGCRKGELTVSGQEQARSLGQWLRQRYVQQHGLLPDAYQEGALHCRTTNYARTKATLQGVLTGLYPGTQQEVPTQVAPDDEEILIGTADSCASLAMLLKQQVRSLKEHASSDAATRRLEADVKAAMGLPAEHRVAFADIFDALTSRQFHAKGWPPGVSEQLYLRIEAEALRRMSQLVGPQLGQERGREIMSLSAGQLLQQLGGAMEAAAAGSSQGGPRLRLLSGHDTTVMPLLVTLIGERMDRWPAYTSNLVIELWERKGPAAEGSDRHFVRFLYNQQPLSLPGVAPGQEISLREFKERHWEPFALSREAYLAACHPRGGKDAEPPAAGAGGDTIQGV